MIREILQFQQAFVDGQGYAGQCSEVEVPKLEVTVREIAAGGMSGAIEVRQNRHPVMTASLTFVGLPQEIYKLFGTKEGNDLPFTVRGSTEDRDGTTHPHVIKMRGFIKSIDEGVWKDGEDVPCKIELSLRYYYREADGQRLLECDPENMVFFSGETDLLAEHRQNIGR